MIINSKLLSVTRNLKRWTAGLYFSFLFLSQQFSSKKNNWCLHFRTFLFYPADDVCSFDSHVRFHRESTSKRHLVHLISEGTWIDQSCLFERGEKNWSQNHVWKSGWFHALFFWISKVSKLLRGKTRSLPSLDCFNLENTFWIFD